MALTCLFAIKYASASHVPGGNITYECVGPNQYLVTLTLFEDCGTAFEGSGNQTLTVTNDCGFSTPTSLSLTNIIYQQEVSQLCPSQIINSECNGGALPGIWMHQWQTTVTLPGPCDSWTFAYSSCCRNTSTNVNGQPGYYWETTLNDVDAPCNNSPFITAQPIPYVCVNQPVNYNLSVVEPDGHLLSFSLIGAQSAAGTVVTYNGGYSAAAPIPGITIDPLTGQINFTPTLVGNYFVAVLIEEYDANGNLVGSVIHDIQIEVINCTNTNPLPAAGITNVTGAANLVNPNTVEACEGSSFCFDVVFTDPDAADILTVTSNIASVLPGAVLTLSGTNPVTANICWTVPGGSPSFLSIALTAEDNACPIAGQSTFPVGIDIINSTTVGPDITICAGQDTALFASGGSIFNWTALSGDPINVGTNFSCNPCQDPIVSPSVTTTYEVISDLSGTCTNKDTIVVNVVPDFTYTVTQSSSTSCLLDDIYLDITPSPAGAYTYNWTPGTGLSSTTASNPVVNHSTPGTYTYDVTITSPDGCIKTNQLSVFVAAAYAPQITAVISDDTVACGNLVNLNVDLLGGVPASCGPSMSGTCVGATTGTTVGTQTSVGTSTGEPSPYSNYYANARHQYLFLASELQAAGFVGGKINAIEWVTTAQNGAQSTFINYQISVGCTNLTNLTSTFQTGLTQVYGPQNTTVVLGTNTHNFSTAYDWDGTSNLIVEVCYDWTAQYQYTYNWSVGLSNPGFTAGLYYRSDGTVACPQPTGTTVTTRPVTTFLTCPTEPDPANYTYSWTPSTGSNAVVSPATQATDASPQTPTWYYITVTDINGGCTATDSVSVFTNCCDPSFQPTLTQTNIDCNGASNGELTANPIGGTGPYTYQWSTGATTQTISGLAPGTYLVTVLSDTCPVYLSATITEPAPFVVTVVTEPSCQGLSTGTADISVSGSNGGPWQFSMDGGTTFVNDSLFTSLASGNYNLVITDGTGCQYTETVNVPESIPPSINSLTIVNPTCVASVGSITVNATGNDAPFNFSFDGGTTYGVNSTAAGLAMGSYDIVVQNSWGCISDTTIYIAPPIPTITATVTDPTCGVNNGQIQAAVSSGTPAYQFSFNGGTTYQGSSLSSGHSGGSFTVIVVDAGGCSDTVNVTMESNAVPVVTINSVTSPLCVGQSGCVDFSVGSGVAPYTFDYGDGSTPGTATTYCGYDAGSYTIAALGDNGCTGTANITVNAPDTVVAVFSATPTSGNPPLTVNFINGSTGATAYDWTFGNGNTSTSSDPTVEYIIDGTYQVILVASNTNGCTDTATVTITVIGVSAMVVPNIITDNGDGANDAFRVEAENIDEFECTIYNRWGSMVYQYTDVNGSWDGENHVDGTYFYVIKALGRDGVQYDLNGTVTLMRP